MLFELNDTEVRVNTEKSGTIDVHKVRTLRIDFSSASIKLMIVRFLIARFSTGEALGYGPQGDR
jgi:hypothetical protein